MNRQIALNLIRSKQPASRAELARLMGCAGRASRSLTSFETGLVFEGTKGESRRGRSPRSWVERGGVA